MFSDQMLSLYTQHDAYAVWMSGNKNLHFKKMFLLKKYIIKVMCLLR